MICFYIYFIFEMSRNDECLRKSKRQHIPNPIYSAGINELKMAWYQINFRSLIQSLKEKGKPKISNLIVMNKNIILEEFLIKLEKKTMSNGFLVFLRMERKLKYRLFRLLNRLMKKSKRNLNHLRKKPQTSWAFFRKLLRTLIIVRNNKVCKICSTTSNK